MSGSDHGAVDRLIWACERTEACGYVVVDEGKVRVADLRFALSRIASLEGALSTSAWRWRYLAKLMQKDPQTVALAPSMIDAAVDAEAALLPNVKPDSEELR